MEITSDFIRIVSYFGSFHEAFFVAFTFLYAEPALVMYLVLLELNKRPFHECFALQCYTYLQLKIKMLYCCFVVQNAGIKSEVIQVSATDEDQSKIITFSIVKGNDVSIPL